MSDLDDIREIRQNGKEVRRVLLERETVIAEREREARRLELTADFREAGVPAEAIEPLVAKMMGGGGDAGDE
jgi:hypothetical protein